MHGLDLILGKASHVLVLRVLVRAEEPMTGREIQRRSGLSNRATMLALDALLAQAVVLCEETPQANWYEINAGNYFVAKALKPIYEAEEAFWQDVGKIIRRSVKPRPTAAVITGPLARDEELTTGRLEITLLFSTGRNRIRAYSSLGPLTDDVWNRYAMHVEVNWVDANNYRDTAYEALWRRIEREGVLLFGALP